MSTVKSGHDEIQCLTLDNRVTDAALEVLKTRPQVERLVAQVEVKVDLVALVQIGLKRDKVSSFTLIVT